MLLCIVRVTRGAALRCAWRRHVSLGKANLAACDKALQVTVHWGITLLCYKTQFCQVSEGSVSQDPATQIKLPRHWYAHQIENVSVMGNVLSPEPGHSGLPCRQHHPESRRLGKSSSSEDLRSMEGVKGSIHRPWIIWTIPTPQERFQKCQHLPFGSFIPSAKLYQAHQQIY